MDRPELGAWLRLLGTPGIGRESARRLLAAFGSPQAVIAADAAALGAVIGPAKAALLAEPPDSLDALLATTWDWLSAPDAAEARAIVPLGDPRYPQRLLESPDPPLLLYTQGRVDLLRAESIAVVGSRNPTAQGADNAKAFSRHLSEAGFTVVSGLALGVDTAAHVGALEGSGGSVAVVGTGLDRVYPKRNLALAHRLAATGLIVSEYPLGMPALAENFPMRNRIIAGLARGTLVIEAALQSGSLITARLANEAGRDVFAIPGSIHSPQSRGCHALIKQGAKLVETAQDVLDELGALGRSPADGAAQAHRQPELDLAPADDPVLAAIGYDPVTMDALAARTGLGVAELGGRLLALEFDGEIARLPGQLFQRTARR